MHAANTIYRNRQRWKPDLTASSTHLLDDPPTWGMSKATGERFNKVVLLRCMVRAVSSDAELVLTPVSPLVPPRHLVTWAISRFDRIWPVAGLGFAVIVNVAWMGFLGFEFFKLIEFAFL